LKDSRGRTIDYLRVSVTDRCNLRCAYCVPLEDTPGCETVQSDDASAVQEGGLLTDQEILRIVRVGRDLGISHVRVTGGEPLTRKGIVGLVEGIKSAGVPDVSMTTNGVLLSKYAEPLKKAGLDRVNISLDSLKASTYAKITRNGKLEDAKAGVRSALSAGLNPVKINVVLMKGINDGEIADLAGLSVDSPLHVRFIEVMPVGPGRDMTGPTAENVLTEIEKHWGELSAESGPAGAGPARSYRIQGAKGTVGVISAMSSPFCDECNRLRLTPDGLLRPCLSLDVEIDLKPILRMPGEHESEIEKGLRRAFGHALELKPAHHDFAASNGHGRRMCRIGG
jgi:cyclic pyranopterin phosphate synthase